MDIDLRITPPAPAVVAGAVFFIAHSDADKPFVRELKAAILRLTAMRQVRARWPKAATVDSRAVFFDEDSGDDADTLAGFAKAAASATCLIVLVPAGGVRPTSFIRKEILAFMTGIEHATRERKDPTSLEAAERARASERLRKVLLVDPRGALTWDDGGVVGLTAMCRGGCLQEWFRTEKPRLRDTGQTARGVARAAIARLWNARPDDVVTAVEEHDRVRFWRWGSGIATVAVILGLTAVVACVQRQEARRQRALATQALRVSESRRLAAASTTARLEGAPVLALLLAAEAVRTAAPHVVTAEAEQSLRDALARIGGHGWEGFAEPVSSIWELPGDRIAAVDVTGAVAAWHWGTSGAAPSRDWRVPSAALVVPAPDGERAPMFVDGDGVLHGWGADGHARATSLASFVRGRDFVARACGLAQASEDAAVIRSWSSDGAPGTDVELPTGALLRALAPSCSHLEVARRGELIVVDRATHHAVHVPADDQGPSAWTPAGDRFVAGHGGALELLELAGTPTRRRIPWRPDDEPRDALAVAFAPDGHGLAMLDRAGRLHYWRDVRTTAPPVSVDALPGLAEADQDETTLAFAPDGAQLLVADSQREVVLVDTQRLRVQPLHRFDKRGSLLVPAGRIPFAFSPRGELLFVVDATDRLQVWQVAPAVVHVTELAGHDGGFRAVRVLRDGSLVTGGMDGSLRRWRPPPVASAADAGRWDVQRARWRASPIELRGARWSAFDGHSHLDIALAEQPAALAVVAEGTRHVLRAYRIGADGVVEPPVALAGARAWGDAWTVVDDDVTGWAWLDLAHDARLRPPPGTALIDVDEDGTAALAVDGGGGATLYTPAAPALLGQALVPPQPGATPLAVDRTRGHVLWRGGLGAVVAGFDGRVVRSWRSPAARLDFCLAGAAVCTDADALMLDGSPTVALEMSGRSPTWNRWRSRRCLALAGQQDTVAYGVAGARRLDVGLGDVTAIACGSRVALGTLDGHVSWMSRLGTWATRRVSERAAMHLEWVPGAERLAIASTPPLLVDVGGDGRAVRLSPEDVPAVAVVASRGWVAFGGDDQVVRIYPLSLAALLELAAITAGRSLTATERRRWLESH